MLSTSFWMRHGFSGFGTHDKSCHGGYKEETFAEFPVLHWKRYADDTWIVIREQEISRFHEFINTIEPSIQFTMEMESDRKISFLDVEVERNSDGGVSFGVFRKSTHTGKYLDYRSQHPYSHKLSVVRSLMDRINTHTSDTKRRELERRKVFADLQANGYPSEFIKKRRVRQTPATVSSVGRVVLPFVSDEIEKIARVLRRFKIKVFYKAPRKLPSLLHAP